MTAFDVSVDPGSDATGVCPWVNGKLVSQELVTLRSPKGMTDHDEKVLYMAKRFRTFLKGLTCDGLHKINRVSIESFGDQYAEHDRRAPIATKSAMIKCGAIRGALMVVASEFTDNVQSHSKGTISKQQTAWIAQSKGIRGSKDALDAFQVGICAGFDRSRN